MAISNGGESEQEWLEYLRKGLKIEDGKDASSTSSHSTQQKKSPPPTKKPAFEPQDLEHLTTPRISLPDELWQLVLQCPCTFPSEVFHTVMLNLVKNPNITSSHLFRADIFYDSEQDHLFNPEDSKQQQGLAKHLKKELQPIRAQWPGFQLERTIVRQLVPRNPQLDKPLVQTCHFFRGVDDEGEEETLVVYIPHVRQIEDMPFYHPSVSQLAFLHSWRQPTPDSPSQPGTLTLLYRPFPSHPQLTPKVSRTALKLLQTIHKHGQGQLRGYEKRVHHDQIIPQKAYQDTYTRLKAKYGKRLSEQWVEVTDPGKHVFEDIAIAAFLIELWRGMYQMPSSADDTDHPNHARTDDDKPPFPGFIDIGCGNGLLTLILLSENYTPGSGFDARQRKTWSTFPPSIQRHLHQKIIVPGVLQDTGTATGDEHWHDGDFGEGTFIISNHADELTPWTPLLAYLNRSGFITIPCCSHDLSGARFRAPVGTRGGKEKEAAGRRLSQQAVKDVVKHEVKNEAKKGVKDDMKDQVKTSTKNSNQPQPTQQGGETGSLQRTSAQKKMPSAYSTLCSYVASLAQDVGFHPEQEVLRIPSTRNTCIVGRKRTWDSKTTMEERKAHVIDVVERELKRDITTVASDWIMQAQKLMKKPGSGH